jgi:hypothetical protein
MSNSVVTYAADRSVVSVDTSGVVRDVAHVDRPQVGYLSLGLPFESGTDLVAGPAATDADEVELPLADPHGLAITVRHSFVAGWQLRCVIANSGPGIRTVHLRLPLTLSPGTAGWAAAEGSEAELFVQPVDGRGPVLSGRLRQGSIRRITDHELEFGAMRLDPGARYVFGWEWRWLARPSAYRARRGTAHPSATICVRGQPVRLPADPDVAVVAPPEVGMEPIEDGYELTAREPCTASVELRSARGLRTLELTWTPTAEQVLGDAAAALLAARRGPVGVAVLTAPEAALVVQSALVAGLVEDADDARDALDLYLTRLDEDDLDPVLAALYLCGEYTRSADPELLAVATRSILRPEQPVPGLGLVATRICVARLLAGWSPQPVMDRLLALSRAAQPDDATTRAVTELLVVTRSADAGGDSRGSPWSNRADADDLLRRILALGTELGSGLPGGPLTPPSDDRLGQVIATLAVVPDDLAEPTRREWGIPARELAARSVPTLLARLDRHAVGRGHVWLSLLVDSR